MRLKLKNDVDIYKVNLKTKKDDEDSQHCAADIKITMLLDDKLGKKLLGEGMYNGLWDNDGDLYHKSFKPRDVFDSHHVSFNGLDAQQVIPRVEKITPSESGDLKLHLTIPYDISDSEAKHELLEALGSHIEMDIKPSQQDLFDDE